VSKSRKRRVSVLASTAEFLGHLGVGLRVVWPVFSGILAIVLGLGLVVAHLEKWPWGDGLYFAMITALTIGYGDLVPTTALTRILAVVLGVLGLLSTAILAALSVHAMRTTIKNGQGPAGEEEF
jgi:hypothetical protein